MVKRSLVLTSLLLSACVPHPISPPTGQIGIQVIWPQRPTGFATQASYSEIESLGVRTMRLSLTDSVKTHNQSVAFSARRASFSGIARGSVRVSLECLDNSGQILFRGEASGSLSSETLTLPVAVESLQDLRAAPPREIPGRSDYTNSLGMKFVKINPGSFLMGSPESEVGRQSDEDLHPVTLTEGYFLQTTEVTQGQWQAVMGTTIRTQRDKAAPKMSLSGEGSNYPMYYVSWDEIQAFIQKLNQKGEGTYRLPTEAEWEYAARAGTTTAYACGDSASCLDTMGWYVGNAGVKIHPVAQKQPNTWGLYDMHGNLWEWVQDWYGDYPSGAVTNPTGPGSGWARIARGGGWGFNAQHARSASRLDSPGDYNNYLGFRLVRRP